MKKKSPRNKTIQLTDHERTIFVSNILQYTEQNLQLKQLSNQIIHGDTLKILPLLPEKFIDLLIVDPPYNLSKNYHGNKFNEISEQKYIEYTESWFSLIYPCLKENASIYVCCDWKSSQAIYMVLKKYVNIQNRITWQREKGRGAQNNWKNGMEDIWFASMTENYYFNIEDVKIKRKVLAPYKSNGIPKDWEQNKEGKFRMTYPSNFWDDISIPYWSMPENTEHPTQKPEKLIAKLILASSQKEEMIFDPFLGSGTTAVVAKKLGRRFCGIEQNLEYCLLAEKRLALADLNNAIQGYTGVFWERNTKPIN